MYTTLQNPGAFSKRKKTRLKVYAKTLLSTLLKQDIRGCMHYLFSEGINIWNDRIPRLKIGNSCTCNICGYSGRFIHKSNRLNIAWNSRCPQCDSRSRHRGLFFLYKELIDPTQSVLHFAPEPVLSVLFKKSVLYKTTDYVLADVDYPGEDIQELSFRDASFDWVLCNHVIEHVPDDTKAIAEISRIMKPGGRAIITIPGDWNRRKTIFFKDLSLNGHYRDYGLDVLDKLRSQFSNVEMINMSKYNRRSGGYGIRKTECAFLCYK